MVTIVGILSLQLLLRCLTAAPASAALAAVTWTSSIANLRETSCEKNNDSNWEQRQGRRIVALDTGPSIFPKGSGRAVHAADGFPHVECYSVFKGR